MSASRGKPAAAGDIVRLGEGLLLCFRQPLLDQQVKDVRRGFRRLLGGFQRRRLTVGQQGKIEQQAVGVIVGRAEHLAAGNILIDRRNSPLQAHVSGIYRLADRQPLQGGAVGAE
ncbi:Uncharacterised protein [Raoultella terrigena]|uniref:Uncharacterized protein n=1 Tax=Raoultella terrigena TaxID=577 RepID=A0A485AV02_RAOTE|nr:Uncharacterised protein [Raoultella terrigena]